MSTGKNGGLRAVGLVAIGRNEGERLVRCLRGAVGRVAHVVYVDSGSTDGSVARAREQGAEVVLLDTSIPFTAARARNAGFERLVELDPSCELVQFVDGDCEVVDGWLETAAEYLRAHPDVAAVCGRRRERFRDASVYNRLTDMEWDTPVGEAEATGGDAMIRSAVFQKVGGYDPALIAGEDPELSFRIRRAGHRIVRLDRDMTLHDAAISEFRQWWKRTVRAGHAFAELAYLHGKGPERYRIRQVRSIVLWGGVLPATGLGLAPASLGASLLLLSGYGLLGYRVYRHRRRRGDARPEAALYAGATTVGKLAEMRGVAQFAWNRFVRRQQSQLIEYKGPESNGPESAERSAMPKETGAGGET